VEETFLQETTQKEEIQNCVGHGLTNILGNIDSLTHI